MGFQGNTPGIHIHTRSYARASRALESFSFAFAPMEKPAEAGQRTALTTAGGEGGTAATAGSDDALTNAAITKAANAGAGRAGTTTGIIALNSIARVKKRSRNHPIT